MDDARAAAVAHAQALKLARGERVAEAAEKFSEAATLAPQSALYLSNYGYALQLLGRPEEAIPLYRRALTLDANFADAHAHLASALRAQGFGAEALPHYQRFAELKPAQASAHHNLGSALMSLRRLNEARASFEKALLLDPNLFDAHTSLGLALIELNETDAARAQARVALQRVNAQTTAEARFYLGALAARCGLAEEARPQLEAYLASDPADRLGARLVLASLGGDIPDRAATGFLEDLYRQRAAGWDAEGGVKNYRGDALVAHAIERAVAGRNRLAILDAGCGTGLVGARLKHLAVRLDGVDLSEPMLAKARAKAIYDTLACADLVETMRERASAYDVIACAATLIHFGNLEPAFAAAHRSLKPGGVFVFTLFPNDDARSFAPHPLPRLAQGGVYAHSRDYVSQTAGGAHFNVEAIEEGIHEYHDGEPRTALVVTLRR